MAHSWDPDRYLTFADERGRPFLELVARIDADAPAPGRRPRLRRRQPDRAARPAVAQAQILGVDSSAEMVAAAPVGEGVEFTVGDIASAGRPDRAGRRTRLQRRAAVGPRPPRPAAAAWSTRSRPAAGWPSRSPATSRSRATPSAASWPPRRRTPSTPPAWPPRTPTTRRRYLHVLRGLGCEVDAWETTYLHVLARRGPGLHLGQRHRRPADAAGAARRPARPRSRRSSSAACARPTRSATARSCCRSGVCSWSPDAWVGPTRARAAAAGSGRCVPGGRDERLGGPCTHLLAVDLRVLVAAVAHHPRTGVADAVGAGPRGPAGRTRCRGRRRRASRSGPYDGTGSPTRLRRPSSRPRNVSTGRDRRVVLGTVHTSVRAAGRGPGSLEQGLARRSAALPTSAGPKTRGKIAAVERADLAAVGDHPRPARAPRGPAGWPWPARSASPGCGRTGSAGSGSRWTSLGLGPAPSASGSAAPGSPARRSRAAPAGAPRAARTWSGPRSRRPPCAPSPSAGSASRAAISPADMPTTSHIEAVATVRVQPARGSSHGGTPHIERDDDDQRDRRGDGADDVEERLGPVGERGRTPGRDAARPGREGRPSPARPASVA